MRILLVLLFLVQAQVASSIVVASKSFTESEILSEILSQRLRNVGKKVEHKRGMGATVIVWQGLLEGEVDIYPEYTGTISAEILKSGKQDSLETIARELKSRYGINVSRKIGFNNSYAMVMRRELAERLGIKKISDLKYHPQLKVGVSHEFLSRKDGWKPLLKKYLLNFDSVKGFQHDLAYKALENGQIDLTDAYSTSTKKEELDLIVLEDDRNFFPKYEAVYLYRDALDEETVAVLNSLDNKIDESLMDRLNSMADRTKNIREPVNYFLGIEFPNDETLSVKSELFGSIIQRGKEHIYLVSVSMVFAIFLGVFLGFIASKFRKLSSSILTLTSILQTIPGLALLALLIPFTGISETTAIIALLLYSLLPIVSNTYQGFTQIDLDHVNTARAIGLNASQIALHIKLPMALPSILTGIRTSLVINVGTATLAALIGVGGYGAPILSGLSLNDQATILTGAIPAACLAALCQIFMIMIEKVLIPKGIILEKGI